MEVENARLLIVDDSDDNRYVLTRRLRRDGFANLAEAADGRQALELLRAAPFDLVFLDIMMPELNGYAVLERMKQDADLRAIPVIIISASEEQSAALRCIEYGADEFLPKPFDPHLLRARLRACLNRKRWHDIETELLARVQAERARGDALLRAIFPEGVIEELKASGTVAPRRHDDVTVLFCDIVGFTRYCDRNAPELVVSNLQALVATFEEITDRYQLEKIKTVGDSFMATGGLTRTLADGPATSILCGLAMVRAAQRTAPFWSVRVGIHSGPLLAGVMGKRQYQFDVWGDTVNTAARIASAAAPNAVWVSQPLWHAASATCIGNSRGVFDLRGKGELELFHCTGSR